MESLAELIGLIPAPPGAAIARTDGETERIDLRDARALFEAGDVLVAHAAFAAGRLGSRANVMLFDVLELFVFVRPGLPFVPSALGLARALGLKAPETAGVPEIVPSVAIKRPAGSPVAENVYAPAPPLAVILTGVMAAPWIAVIAAQVAITGGFTVTEQLIVALFPAESATVTV